METILNKESRAAIELMIADGLIAKDTAERYFPELKESNDEQIRKWLIRTLKSLNNSPVQIDGAYEMILPAIAWLEGQGEQKPTDKVEPKFHKGEWLCENEPNNYARFIQILEIVNVQGKDRYRISRDIHKDEDVAEFRFVEKYYHKFDIQDAKDGDVLADDYGIYIFEKFDECDKNSYVCIGTYQYSQKVYECEHMLCSTDAHPATKEQRDLLFQKMHEAGYEWGAEKKELKRIEQMPAEIEKLAKGNERENPISVCSEEDEKMLNDIIKDLVHPWNEYIPDRIEDEIKWLKNRLKSLRLQNTWKPSEEQMVTLEYYMHTLVCNSYKETLFSLYQDLKKLMEG